MDFDNIVAYVVLGMFALLIISICVTILSRKRIFVSTKNIITKYNIDDEVYFESKGEIEKRKIVGIMIWKGSIDYIFDVFDFYNTKEEKEVFNNAEDLKNKMLEDFKCKNKIK